MSYTLSVGWCVECGETIKPNTKVWAVGTLDEHGHFRVLPNLIVSCEECGGMW